MKTDADILEEALERISSGAGYDDDTRMKDCRVIARKALSDYQNHKAKQPSGDVVKGLLEIHSHIMAFYSESVTEDNHLSSLTSAISLIQSQADEITRLTQEQS